VAKKKKEVVKEAKVEPKKEVIIPKVDTVKVAKESPNKALSEVKAVLSLLDSMIRNGESHNDTSIAMCKKATKTLEGLIM